MTNDQFDALATLLRMKEGRRKEGARLVMVEGCRPADAARAVDVTPQTVSNALASCRAGMELVRIAAGHR